MFALLLAAGASAQTYVVDASGAGNFLSIAAATAAVPSGSTLHVRPGTYESFTVSAKSLKILCDAGAEVYYQFGGGFSVQGLTPDQSVVVAGLRLDAAWGARPRIDCSSCQGSVLLDGISVENPEVGEVTATDCSQLLIRGLWPATGWRSCTLTNCNTVLEGVPLATGLIGVALTQNGGTLQAVGCSFQGGLPFGGTAGGAILLTQGASLRLLAGSSVWVAPTVTAGIDGVGTVRHDPTVSLSAAPAGPTVVATQQAMPALTSAYAGGVATATLAGASGHFGVIGVALPGPIVSLPGIDDPLWLDLASFFPVTFGPVSTGAPLQAQLPWTPGPMRGVRVLWQALTFDPAGPLHLSNPSLTLLP